jgi:hypothetical protein
MFTTQQCLTLKSQQHGNPKAPPQRQQWSLLTVLLDPPHLICVAWRLVVVREGHEASTPHHQNPKHKSLQQLARKSLAKRT